jgi:hypothetical protein
VDTAEDTTFDRRKAREVFHLGFYESLKQHKSLVYFEGFFKISVEDP